MAKDKKTAGGPAPAALADVGLTFQAKVSLARVEKSLSDEATRLKNVHQFDFPDGFSVFTEFALNDDQQAALSSLAEWSHSPNMPLYNLQGYAGTGKTTILRLFVKYLLRKQSRALVLAAPTHRAKQVLYKLAGTQIERENCVTLHTLLSLKPTFDMENLDLRNLAYNQNGESKMPPGGLVIVDEVSMVGDGVFDVLVKIATDKGCKLLLVGDPAQLKPVKQDTLSRCFLVKYMSELRQVMRQSGGNPISYLLEDIRNNQTKAVDSFVRYDRLSAHDEGIRFTHDSALCKEWVNERLLSADFEADPNFVRVLAGTNRRVEAYNASMRAVRYGENAAEYMEGEILTGYANYGSDDDFQNLITNSADYLVVSAQPTSRELIGMPVEGWWLTVVEADHDQPIHRRPKKSVFVIANTVGQDTLRLLGEHLNSLQKEAVRKSKLKPKPRGAWDEFHRFKESFCTSKEYKRGTYTLITKTLGYGYALTVHKSQGGTYSHVLVDEADIDKAFWEDHQLRHQLKYVAFSRASQQVLCFTGKPIVVPQHDF